MILRVKDSLWDITTKDHKRQRNSEPKPLLQKLCLLYSGTLKVCSLTSWKKGAIVKSECYIETLKNKKNASRGRWQKSVMSCFNKTMPGLTQELPQLMPLHVWGVHCCHIQPTARISPARIFTCSPNWRKTSGAKKLQFWWRSTGCNMLVVLVERKRLFLRTEFKNLLNVGKSVLQLEEIVWKSGCAQL